MNEHFNYAADDKSASRLPSPDGNSFPETGSYLPTVNEAFLKWFHGPFIRYPFMDISIRTPPFGNNFAVEKKYLDPEEVKIFTQSSKKQDFYIPSIYFSSKQTIFEIVKSSQGELYFPALKKIVEDNKNKSSSWEKRFVEALNTWGVSINDWDPITDVEGLKGDNFELDDHLNMFFISKRESDGFKVIFRSNEHKSEWKVADLDEVFNVQPEKLKEFIRERYGNYVITAMAEYLNDDLQSIRKFREEFGSSSFPNWVNLYFQRVNMNYQDSNEMLATLSQFLDYSCGIDDNYQKEVRLFQRFYITPNYVDGKPVKGNLYSYLINLYQNPSINDNLRKASHDALNFFTSITLENAHEFSGYSSHAVNLMNYESNDLDILEALVQHCPFYLDFTKEQEIDKNTQVILDELSERRKKFCNDWNLREDIFGKIQNIVTIPEGMNPEEMGPMFHKFSEEYQFYFRTGWILSKKLGVDDLILHFIEDFRKKTGHSFDRNKMIEALSAFNTPRTP